MKKIQTTIAIYVLVVVVMSIFFMPMNKVLMLKDQTNLLSVEYRCFWTTDLRQVDDAYIVYVYDYDTYELHLKIISVVALSIIAIQALEVFKQKQIADNFKQLGLFDND